MTIESGSFRFRDLPDGRLEVRLVLTDGCTFSRTILTTDQRNALTAAAEVTR
jgi:hypothetical protein